MYLILLFKKFIGYFLVAYHLPNGDKLVVFNCARFWGLERKHIYSACHKLICEVHLKVKLFALIIRS